MMIDCKNNSNLVTFFSRGHYLVKITFMGMYLYIYINLWLVKG
ncbi:hypothetical protein LCGC14_0225500 [marine sediment metagenome]|uniref:Uncharacterized protein n=1 Tax=marine sediment metagenome TaxID=412755 RepID=A0A0F9WX39_9ZZZZ